MTIIESGLFLLTEIVLVFLTYVWFWHDAEDRTSAVLKTYLSWAGYCVLSFFALDIFALLNNRVAFVGLNLISSALLSVGIYRRSDTNFFRRIPESNFFRSRVGYRKTNKYIIIAYLWLAFCYFCTMVANFASSPTVDDELTSYLVRIEHWIRAGFIQEFDTYPYHSTLNIYPIAFQSILLKLRLISGTDLTYQFLTFAGILITSLVIYKISHQLTKSPIMSNFGVIIFLATPFTLQAAGMNLVDVFTTSLIVIFVYFVLFYRHEQVNKRIFFGLLALSLAISAKQSTIFFIPGFTILLLLALRSGNKITLSHKWLSAFFLFLLIATPIYIRNYFLYGNLLGNAEAFSFYTGEDTGGIKERIYLLQYNLTRFLYFFFLGDSPDSIKKFILIPLFDGFGSISGNILIDLHHLGVSYYGFLVVPSLLVLGLVLFVRTSSRSFNTDPLNSVIGRILLIIGITLPIFLFLLSRTFTHAFSRYLFPVYSLLIPLMVAGLYSISFKKLISKKLKIVSAFFAIWLFVFSTPVVFSSGLKPLIGNGNVFQLSRQEESVLWIRTLQGDENAQEFLHIYQQVHEMSVLNRTICLDVRKKFSAYPFLYKNSSLDVIWVVLEVAKQSRLMTRQLTNCNLLLTDNKELDSQLAELYKTREYFELSQVALYSQQISKEF